MKTAQQIYDAEIRNCARSSEWKAGTLRGLQKALGEPASPAGVPYAAGTSQDDAWRAGYQHGLAEGKALA
ncbi:hypothetical protein N5K37_24555 [Delftia tsuruhatensis]|uniref:hypothetical protein n=1 Tax=Delftia tsuruhatensis TaxID=180282 RepID=UPI0010562D4C|nr:hypothetical protein [Delftia tsuruhatensis]MDH2233084.1 hypothetical protein [Delftia tsuruhatensis]TDF28478.1 hypothetical protein EZI45_13625 [Delftia tsuruhatensis]